MLKSGPYKKMPHFIRKFKKKLDLWEMNQKYKNFISKTCMAYKHSFFTHVSFKIYVLPIFTLIWTLSDSSLTESHQSLYIETRVFLPSEQNMIQCLYVPRKPCVKHFWPLSCICWCFLCIWTLLVHCSWHFITRVSTSLAESLFRDSGGMGKHAKNYSVWKN